MMSYAYDTIADIIRLAEENNISFGEVVLRYELENYDRSEEAVIREIEHRLDILKVLFKMVQTMQKKQRLACPVARQHSLMDKHQDL